MSSGQLNSGSTRYQSRKARQQKKRIRSFLAYGAVLLGLLAFIALIYYLPRQVLTQEKFEIEQDEIVYGEPVHAVHEMTGAQLAKVPFYPSNEPQPKLQATHPFYDLGSIGSDDVVVHEIAIRNIGDAPLIINRAYTTCGCTTAHIDASELQPGEMTLVTVTLDAGYHDVRGQTVRRGVIIENNDPDNSEFTFWMEASVRTTP